MLFSNIPGMQSTPTVQRRMKGLATKIPVSCLDVIKMYNQGMGGVDLFGQRTAVYHLDCKSAIRFYLHTFFRFDECSLCQRHHRLQYDTSKRPYPA